MTFTFSFKCVTNHVHNYGKIPFSTKFKNYLVFQYFDFEWILWKLFQKPVVCTNLSRGGLWRCGTKCSVLYVLEQPTVDNSIVGFNWEQFDNWLNTTLTLGYAYLIIEDTNCDFEMSNSQEKTSICEFNLFLHMTRHFYFDYITTCTSVLVNQCESYNVHGWLGFGYLTLNSK